MDGNLTLFTMKNTARVTSLFLLLLFVACSQQNSNNQALADAIRKANDELFNKGNLDFADQIFTSDYANEGPILVKNFVKQRREAFPDLQVVVDSIIVSGNTVAWTRINTGTQKGDYNGQKAMGQKTTWREVIFSRFNADGKIAEETGTGDFREAIQQAISMEGVFEYLPPANGQVMIRNGRFSFIFGPPAQMKNQSGTYTISNDTITSFIKFSTAPKDIGTSVKWKVKSWSGDTLSFVVFNAKNEVAVEGRCVRVSQ
jgi:predicted ester cyclase